MRFFRFVVACGLALIAATASAAAAAGIAGSWALYAMDRGEITDATRLQLSLSGTTVSGKGSGLVLSGTQAGDDLNLVATREDGSAFGTFAIHVDGDNARGTIRRGNTTTVIALRRLPPRTAPKMVTFQPQGYTRLFGGGEPVLRINAGDTVRTSTLDAGGRDGSDTARSLGGNPQTGPIYVEGAIPGDTLSVTIVRIRLNKTIARSGTMVPPSALTADYARAAQSDPKLDGEWTLDRDGGTAMLAHPSERLKDFKIALKPMIGGLGVAPARNEAFRTQHLGSYGGNLDYNGLVEGTTVYLPVSREGALLHVGDVHARQGDGELTGDALETSAEVELRIDVIPGPATAGPRAENADYLMSMGIAGSMEAALRQATTQMAQWLERDYSLTAGEAAIVLGTSLQYEIAEVVDPQINIVAKIPKAALASLKPVAGTMDRTSR
jgi:acetamidase/formamidase